MTGQFSDATSMTLHSCYSSKYTKIPHLTKRWGLLLYTQNIDACDSVGGSEPLKQDFVIGGLGFFYAVDDCGQPIPVDVVYAVWVDSSHSAIVVDGHAEKLCIIVEELLVPVKIDIQRVGMPMGDVIYIDAV